MTYRVVKDEPCLGDGVYEPCHGVQKCPGCNGDGTRMVEVATVVNDDQPWMWVEVA